MNIGLRKVKEISSYVRDPLLDLPRPSAEDPPVEFLRSGAENPPLDLLRPGAETIFFSI